MAEAQGRVIQASVWIIGGQPASIIFREGKAGKHFEDSNPFLLHTVQGDSHETFYFNNKEATEAKRRALYGGNPMTDNTIYRKYGNEARAGMIWRADYEHYWSTSLEERPEDYPWRKWTSYISL